MTPIHVIDLDGIIPIFKQAYSVIRNIFESFAVTIANHTYNGWYVLIALLVFFWLVEWIWGGDDDSEDG